MNQWGIRPYETCFALQNLFCFPWSSSSWFAFQWEATTVDGRKLCKSWKSLPTNQLVQDFSHKGTISIHFPVWMEINFPVYQIAVVTQKQCLGPSFSLLKSLRLAQSRQPYNLEFVFQRHIQLWIFFCPNFEFHPQLPIHQSLNMTLAPKQSGRHHFSFQPRCHGWNCGSQQAAGRTSNLGWC